MMEATLKNRRMYLQELALLGIVRKGEAEPRELFGRTIYKLKTENPWEKTPNFVSPFVKNPSGKRTRLPQQEILPEIR